MDKGGRLYLHKNSELAHFCRLLRYQLTEQLKCHIHLTTHTTACVCDQRANHLLHNKHTCTGHQSRSLNDVRAHKSAVCLLWAGIKRYFLPADSRSQRQWRPVCTCDLRKAPHSSLENARVPELEPELMGNNPASPVWNIYTTVYLICTREVNTSGSIIRAVS